MPPPASRAAKFNNVHSVHLHLPTNFGADFTEIHFIGLKGEFIDVSNTAGFFRRCCRVVHGLP
jgi:hypothetical protein